MKKNLLKIYDIFKSNENIRKTDSFSDINKATNKILTNKKKYKLYFKEYTKNTEVYSFKTPGITHYPLLQKKSCSLLPIHRTKIEYYEDILENKKDIEKKEKLYLFGKNKFLVNSPRETIYKDKMKHNLKIAKNIFKNRLLNLEKAKFEKLNNNQRYNSLFLDFFYKWNKDKNDFLLNEENSKVDNVSAYQNKNFSSNDYKYIINDKYSELKYDDNLIFNSNYTNFVNERLEYILLNNIENNNIKLESNFNDFNQNEIKLRLESIKIKFTPIRSKISALDSQNKITELYIPLYFTFLFCIKDVDFFKYVILSCITFSENDKIIFDEDKIKPSLKAYFEQRREENAEPKTIVRNSGVINTMNKKTTTTFRRTATKSGFPMRKSTVGKKGTTTVNNNNNSKIFNLARNSILENDFFSMNNNKKKKKEEIIHSNKKNINYFYNSSNNGKNKEEQNKINSRKEINQYDEYIFIWETNDKTYSVNIKMPIIFFNYKNLKEEIALYCDKTLFLYMYKHHFINWDFYALNYLFSIKIFRKRILQNYSLMNKNILATILPHSTINNNNITENTILKYMNKTGRLINEDNLIKNDKFELNEEITILNRDKNKIYNMINPINESFLFFYTDNLYQNTLIKMHSYIIILDYDKLNPKVQWKYILNFKLMKLLNEISKYEPLETFIPKITKTDFQNGRLSIDFSLFHQFNINILGYEKKNINEENNSIFNYSNLKNKGGANLSKENEELCVEIKFPFYKEEKIVKGENEKMLFKKTNTNLDINFLQNLNNYKMDLWPKKLLEIINIRNNNKFSDNNYLNNITKKNTYDNEHKVISGFDHKKFTKHISHNYSQFSNKLSKLS